MSSEESSGSAAASAARVGSIEKRGIEPVSDVGRYGHARDLFPIWFGVSSTVISITVGAALVTFIGLNLWQSAIAAAIGSIASFALLGALSVAGKWGGAPTLTLSRASFGVLGNRGPVFVSWINLLGWTSFATMATAYAFLALINKVFHAPTNDTTSVIALLFVLALTMSVSVFGHATIVRLQQIGLFVFLASNIPLIIFLVWHVNWRTVWDTPGGSFTSVVAGSSYIAAAAGIALITQGPNYARYLPHSESGRRITGWVTAGAAGPLIVMGVLGALLAATNPGLAGATNPVAAIVTYLPSWVMIPFLIVTVATMATVNSLMLYSAGLDLLALGVPLRRPVSVGVNSVLVLLASGYVLIVSSNFYGTLITFLTLLAVPLAAWAAVFGLHMLFERGYDSSALLDQSPRGRYWYTRGFCIPNVVAWIVGITVGLLFTYAAVSPTEVWINGPWTATWVGRAQLGFVVAGVCSGLYVLLDRLVRYAWQALRTAPLPEAAPSGDLSPETVTEP